ncbi:MAG: PKD domain-containing protein, partial [Halobacteriales archaeon]|nr:PKD domain-containing protein [Halobacteriales archaeon]
MTIDRVTTTRGDERVTGVVAGQPVELHLVYDGLGSGIHDLSIRDANSGEHVLNTSVVGDAGSANIGISGSALATAHAASPDTIDLEVVGRGTTSALYSMDKIGRATMYLTDVPPRADQDEPVTVSYYGWTHETVVLTLGVDHPPLTDNTGEDEAIQTVRITPPSGGSRPYVFSGDLTFTPSDFRESPDDPAIRIQLRESMSPDPTTYWSNGEWIRITNDPPVADFTFAPRQPRVNQTVSFDASGSSDPDGRIERYAWDFDGDGTTDATGQFTNHTFQASGDHTVALTVTDDGGASTTLRVRVPVIASPTASFRVHPDDPVTDRPVTFDASTST